GDPNNFIKQQEWDQLKKELCKENLIALSIGISDRKISLKE
ncbi:8833_t:CDS:2, partial [Funneliformis geosporum]